MYLPLFTSRVAAGFPAPSEAHSDAHIDIEQLVVPHPHSSFFVRAMGDSMLEVGILSGDLLVVDKSKTPRAEDIVIAHTEGEFLVKRLRQVGTQLVLVAENKHSFFKPLPVNETVEIWGVVTGVVRIL